MGEGVLVSACGQLLCVGPGAFWVSARPLPCTRGTFESLAPLPSGREPDPETGGKNQDPFCMGDTRMAS